MQRWNKLYSPEPSPCPLLEAPEGWIKNYWPQGIKSDSPDKFIMGLDGGGGIFSSINPQNCQQGRPIPSAQGKGRNPYPLPHLVLGLSLADLFSLTQAAAPFFSPTGAGGRC